jgi:photosystem II stability/assembly factor-like uncharacterized protein
MFFKEKIRVLNLFVLSLTAVLIVSCNEQFQNKIDFKLKDLSNTPPILQSVTCVDTNLIEGETLSCSSTAQDADSDPLQFRLSSSNTCSGALVDSSTGAVTFVTNNNAVPACLLSLEVYDGELVSNRVNVPVTVTNAVPTLTIADATVVEDTVILRADTDVESSEGDAGVYSLDDAGTSGTKCSSVGVLSINSTSGEVSLSAPNWSGNCNVKVTYDDGNGGVATDEFSVTVTPVNDAPSLSGTCGGALVQDSAYSCAALSGSDPENDTLTWELASSNTCAFLSINSSTGEVTGSANDDEVGDCTLAVRVGDGSLFSSVYSRTISVSNLQPTLTIADVSVADPSGTTIIAQDSDVEANEEGFGTYSLDNAGTSGAKCSDLGTLTIDPSTGAVSLAGLNNFSGTCNVKVVFNDQNASANTVSDEFTLTVTDTLGPEVLKVTSPESNGTYFLGDLVTVEVQFNEDVVVNTAGGTPRILLETGVVDRYADYVSGSGSKNLIFSYTVQPDDSSVDLDVASAPGAIELNGGTFKDSSTNNAVLTLPLAADANSLKSQKDLVISGNFPFAILSDVPSPIARTSKTSMTVGGTGIVSYKYKWGLKASTDCSDSTGYSAETDISDKIQEVLTSVVVGNSVIFCVVGKNSTNVWQPYSVATTAEWVKGEYSMGPITFNGLSNLPNWRDVKIDPLGRIYALNARGEIFRTLDHGATWEIQCKITPDDNAHFKFDESSNAKRYIVSGGNVRRVESSNGAFCPSLTETLTDFNYTFLSSPLAIDNEGTLYLFIANSTAQKDDLYKSTDFGASWSLVVSLSNHGWSSSFAIDPQDKNRMIRFVPDDVDGTKDGVYSSTDAGSTWTLMNPLELTLVDIQYKKTAANTFFTSSGSTSTNSGTTMTLITGTTGVADNRKFQIIDDGSGYFLLESGASTLLQRTPNYAISAASTLYTFSNVLSSKNNQSISVRGTTIAAIAGGRLFISSNSGASFSETNWMGTKLALLTGITVKDGKTVYGVTADWNVLKSNDAGETWQFLYTEGNGCIGAEPRIMTHDLDPNRVSIWSGSVTINCQAYANSNDGINFISNLATPSIANRTHILDPLNPNFEAFVQGAGLKYTFDGSNDWKQKNASIGYANPHLDGFYFSETADIWFMKMPIQLMKRNFYSQTDGTITTGLTNPAGLDVFMNEAGVLEARVISDVGQMRRSLDKGATFADLGTSAALPACQKRYLSSLPQNRNVMATICNDGDDLTFTINGGATWRTIDLDGLYGINCDSKGIALSPNKILVACKSYDVLYIRYNAIELVNEAYDSILSSADLLQSNPIIVNTIEDEFVSSEYALIPAGSTCDETLTFSSTIPRTDDPALASNGSYQVCVKLTDASSVVSFERSPVFKVDADMPSAGSIGLIGDLGDLILRRHEHLDHVTPIADGITGANLDIEAFAIIRDTETCDGSKAFSYAIPNSSLEDQFVSIDSGPWKICGRVTDAASNGASYVSSPVFTYDDTAVYATLSNLPKPITNDLDLNVTVGGVGVTSYRYKLTTTLGGCKSETGYSSEQLVSTPITDSLLSFKTTGKTNTSLVNLCVVANNGTDGWQPFSEATTHTFRVYRYSGEFIYPDDPDMENWKRGWIDIHSNSIFYGVDYSGMVYRSSNGGVSWTPLCQINENITVFSNAEIAFKQSRGSDKSLYLFSSAQGDIHRIEALAGASCLNLTANTPFVSYPAMDSMFNFDVASDGTLYIVTNNTTDKVENIYKSINRGLTWIRTGGNVSKELTTGSFGTIGVRVDPFNSNRLLASYINGSRSDLIGIHESLDSGKTWTFLKATSALYIEPSPTQNGLWYGSPSTNGPGTCTTDNWATTTTCSVFAYDGFKLSDPRKRLNSSGEVFNRTNVFQANQLTVFDISKYSSSLSSTGTFQFQIPGVLAKESDTTIDFRIEGSSVIFTHAGRMYISTDGGANFLKVMAVDPSAIQMAIFERSSDGRGMSFMSPWSKLGTRSAYITTDGGESWIRKLNPNATCSSTPHNLVSDLTYGQFTSYSNNCGTTAIHGDSVVSSSTTLEYRLKNIDEPEKSLRFNNSTAGITFDSWKSYDLVDLPFTYIASPRNLFFRNGFVDPRDSTKFFVMTDKSTASAESHLALVDSKDGSKVSLEGNLTFANGLPVSGIALTKDGSGGHYLYATNNQGLVSRSDDYGLSFTPVRSTSVGMTCSDTKYMVHPEDYRYQAVICQGSSTYLSWDGGVNFTSVLSPLSFDQRFGSCTQSPVEFDGRHLFYDCTRGVLKVTFEDFELTTNVIDRHLDVSEKASNFPLVTTIGSGYVTSYGYAVVSAATVCDGSVTYSSSIPTSADPAFSTPGAYKVCVKIDDGAISYKETPNINYTDGLPVFTSVALINDVLDGELSYKENQDSPEFLLGSLIASNYKEVSYQVVDMLADCSFQSDYKNYPPRSNLLGHEITLTDGSSYKVCLKLTNPSGSTYGASSTFIYKVSYPVATLATEPKIMMKGGGSYISAILGNDVTHYRLKWGREDRISCASNSNYSSDTPVATDMNLSLPSLSSPVKYRICIVGKDSQNLWQPFSLATTYTFLVGPLSMSYLKPSDVLIHSWVTATVSPFDSNVIAALNASGDVFKSTDGGTTWKRMCYTSSAEYSNNARPSLIFANDSDKTLYVSGSYTAGGSFLVTDSSDKCPSIAGHAIETDSSGHVYALTNVPTLNNATGVYKSVDKGKTWTTLLTKGGSQTGAIHVGRANNDEIYYVSGSPSFLTVSDDGGLTWTDQPTGIVNPGLLISSPLVPSAIFSPQSNNYSLNNGGTLVTVTKLPIHIDGTGVAYRFHFVNSSQTNLQKNTDVTGGGTWTDVYSFMNVIQSLIGYESISVSGTKMAVILNKRLFLSNDSGATFTQVNLSHGHHVITNVARTANDLYALTSTFALLRSSDLGATWTKVNELDLLITNYARFMYLPFSSTGNLTVTPQASGTYSSTDFLGTTSNPGLAFGNFCFFENILDPDVSVISAVSMFYSTFDGFATQTASTESISASCGKYSRNSYINPSNTNEILVPAAASKYNLSTNTSSSISTGLTGTFSDFELFDNAGVLTLRAIDQRGNIRVSTNFGTSFSAYGTAANPFSSNLGQTTMISDPDHREKILNYSNSLISFTMDGAQTWTQPIRMSSFQKDFDCNTFEDAIMFNDGTQKAIITCSQSNNPRRALLLEF